MRGYLDLGYRTVKMKIGGAPLAEDLRRIEAVVEVLDGDARRLAVDANGAVRPGYRDRLRQGARAAGSALVRRSRATRWTMPLQQSLAEYYPPADGDRGEPVLPTRTPRNLLSLPRVAAGSRRCCSSTRRCPTDWWTYLRTLEGCWTAPAWSRGGAACRMADTSSPSPIAAGLGLGGQRNPSPGIFAPFGGFADGVPVEDGRVRLPDSPGIGFETKPALMDLFGRLFD